MQKSVGCARLSMIHIAAVDPGWRVDSRSSSRNSEPLGALSVKQILEETTRYKTTAVDINDISLTIINLYCLCAKALPRVMSSIPCKFPVRTPCHFCHFLGYITELNDEDAQELNKIIREAGIRDP